MGTLVAVDAQNLYYSAKRAGGEVDYKKLWAHIQSKEPDSFSIAYIVRTNHHDSASFESLMRGIGYRLSTRMAERVIEDGKSRLRFGNHDVRIAVDAVTKYVDQYDKLVIVTGESDFSAVFDYVKSKGKSTELWSYTRGISPIFLGGVDNMRLLGPELLHLPSSGGR